MNEHEAGELVSELYDSAYSLLLRYTARATGSLAPAEDIVQEAFTRLYRDLRRGHRIENPKAWLYSVVRHEILSHHRQQKMLGGLDQWDGRSPRERHPGSGGDPLDGDEVTRLLSVLSPREVEVVLLRLNNLKYREIGAELGMSVKAVGTLLARGLAKLRHAFAEGAGCGSITSHVEQNTPKTLH